MNSKLLPSKHLSNQQMTITYLNEPFNFIGPDTAVIRTSRALLERKLAARETLYLPALKERLTTLSKLFYQLDDYARDMLASAPVELQTQEISSLLAEISDSAALEPKSTANSVAERYRAELSITLKATLHTMDEHAAALGERLDNLRAWALGDSASYIAAQDRQRASIQRALEALTAQSAQLERVKQPLTDAMKVYEDMTILDRWIPILEDVIKLRPLHPAINTLQAGVIGVKNILSIASEAVKYGDLLEARDRVQADLDGKYRQIADHKQQLRELSARNDDLSELQDIAAPKQQYEEQLQKLVTTLQTFITLRERQANEPVVDFARAFILQADALSKVLRTVLKTW